MANRAIRFASRCMRDSQMILGLHREAYKKLVK
jgi:hypothetical protein